MNKKALWLIPAVPAVGAALFTEELYRYVFCRSSSALFTLLFDKKGHEEGYYTYRREALDLLNSVPFREYTITSPRGPRLKGFYYPNGSQGRTIAFVVHGYRSDHADTASLCYAYYRSRGIDVFACDHTAAGESGGHFIGFDVFETQDCLKWIHFLRETFGHDVRIILHGFSMGAATVLQMSSHCPDNVKFIVEDSGFLNARASLDHQVGPMYQPLRVINRFVAGYDINQSDVSESLFAARVPILFVHGRDDALVPFENGPTLYGLYQGEKDCFFPENTRHIESMYTHPREYGEKIDAFLEKYIPNRVISDE